MDPEIRSRSSKRTSTACEPCRAAKVRCQASDQPGVCERCLAVKRECISRTRPRPRRWERKWGTRDSGHSPQSPSHRGTFSINYTVPVQADLSDSFETLREMHDQALDALLSEEDPLDHSQSASQSAKLSSPSIFPGDSPISYLASTKPFTLLSILTVASGSKMVQKHALYDDEFRKALGLKYVSGGEKSLELLQGLLIYCAWYPFHLRPKTGQLVHFLRIAADLIHDLHLDEDFLTIPDQVTDDELDKIRTYLAYLYLVSTYVVVWRGERDLPTNCPPWARNAIDILQHNARVDGDNTLVALVRLSSLFFDAAKAINDRDVLTVQNSRLILIGLEQQYQELRHSMNHLIMGIGPIRMQAMFVDVFLDCGSLLAFPVAETYLSAKTTSFPPPLSKIFSATKKIRALLDYVGGLEDSSLLSFTINDWTRLIMVLTLSFRLSFPLSLYPDLDSACARSELQLDRFLSKMSHGADDTASNDLLSASRALLGLAKSKYDRRVGSLGKLPFVASPSRVFGCPVMNGSLRTSVGQWEQSFTDSSDAGDPKNLTIFHDVWATMTAGWGNGRDIPWDPT
ncbi:hypothetical protein UA08_07329 [Talaromyces atroroseus]|uniref:Zn(2)-C6 fungal-type domain-containing protein n=1 Tax=Talaromyces atroroseus TaxID=1441469 RepID=A0A225ARW6_TALAT|nr:hypothetical protein UA08_07329 [Talaromyces atroroseus]OKL57185.1 hypothetical protein UA08_07329 [Talaromyces atroroseus]